MGLLNSLQYAFTASKDGGLVKWAVGEEAEGGAAEAALTTEEEVEEADTMIGEEDMMTEEVAADITMIEVG